MMSSIKAKLTPLPCQKIKDAATSKPLSFSTRSVNFYAFIPKIFMHDMAAAAKHHAHHVSKLFFFFECSQVSKTTAAGMIHHKTNVIHIKKF